LAHPVKVRPGHPRQREAIACLLPAPPSAGPAQIFGEVVTLVPVAAILVASIRLHFVDVLLHLNYPGPNLIACDAVLRKGDPMGWFQHGSTLIVLAPGHYEPCAHVRQGTTVRMGQPLLRSRKT
jgi:phosphatidylserine decarboxylase